MTPDPVGVTLPELLVCTWSQQDDGGDCYSTGCNHEFIVIDGPPTWPYCCYCAKPIKAVAWTEDEA